MKIIITENQLKKLINEQVTTPIDSSTWNNDVVSKLKSFGFKHSRYNPFEDMISIYAPKESETPGFCEGGKSMCCDELVKNNIKVKLACWGSSRSESPKIIVQTDQNTSKEFEISSNTINQAINYANQKSLYQV